MPAKFTAQNPAIAFTHNTNSAHMTIDSHPLASKLPSATPQPSIQPPMAQFVSFAASPDVPITIEVLMARSSPQLHLHMTSFADATLVGLVWPHTAMDAVGLAELLRAWSLVLAGRETEVPRVLGASEDVLSRIAAAARDDEPEVDQAFEAHRLDGWSKATFTLRFLWDALRHRGVQQKLICLPKHALATLRAAVEHGSSSSSSNDSSEDSVHAGKTFVNEHDVLTAWAAHMVAVAEGGGGRPLTVASAVNLRFRLAKRLNAGPGVYMQNLVFAVFTFLNGEVALGPLRPIAEAHRGHLAAQTTEGRVLGLVRYFCREREAGREAAIALYGRADSIPVIVNNLTKLDMLRAADFAPAVIEQGTCEDGVGATGRMTYWHMQGVKAQSSQSWFRNIFLVLGKDHDENCWISATLAKRTWMVVEHELNRMGQLPADG